MSSPLRHWLHANINPAFHRQPPCLAARLSKLPNTHTFRPSLLEQSRRRISSSQFRTYSFRPIHAQVKAKSEAKNPPNVYPPRHSVDLVSALPSKVLGRAMRLLHRARSGFYGWFEGCSGRAWWWRRAKQVVMFTAHALNAFFLIHLVFAHIGRLSITTGPSMLPTFATSGEMIIEDRLSIRHLNAPLVRGDLLVVESPLERGQMVCKRLLGLPGDVLCVDPTGEYAPSTEHVKVPPGHVWISGDNAEWSRDSRVYGPVPIALVKGRIVARVWPPHKFTLFPSGSGINFLT